MQEWTQRNKQIVNGLEKSQMKTLDLRNRKSKKECPCTEEELKIYKDRILNLISENRELKDKISNLKQIKMIPLLVSFMITFFFNYLVISYWIDGDVSISQISIIFIIDWFMSLFAYYGILFGYWIYEEFEEGLNDEK
jgi:hypothetical protein